MKRLTEEFRRVISEEGELGFLIAADALQESEGDQNRSLGELLRLYCNIQTYVRTSQPIPQSMGFRFEELNKTFKSQLRRYAAEYGYAAYSKPLGPYYTALSVPKIELVQNIDLIVQEPVRELVITDIRDVVDLDLIFRNYRMESMFNLTLNVLGQSKATPMVLGAAIKNLSGASLRSLTVLGLRDTAKAVEVNFMMASKIAKGCSLYMGARYSMPILMRTKK